MAFEYHLPDLAEGMIEAEVVSWKVGLGDNVALDQPVVEILTDKATMEIPSPRAGTLAKINYGEGEVCPVGEVLFVIDEGASQAAGAPRASRKVSPPAMSETAKSMMESALDVAPAATTGKPDVYDATTSRRRVLATPSTRRLARKLGVDLGRVQPSGKRGRVTTRDVESFAQGTRPMPAVPAAAAPVAPAPAPAVRQGTPMPIPSTGREHRIPFRGVRKLISDNMTRSKFTATHFTYVEEVDVTELVALRARAKQNAAERGVKLTYLPFIMKAVVAGLKKHPSLNASLDEAAQEIVHKHYYNLGIAAQGPQGLMVSVVRDADQRSVFGLATEVDRLSKAVQDGTATRDDLTGSTFTITSLGVLGGVLATPIINFPEVGILGVHKIEQRPAVVDGQIVARWRMNLSISLDHRIVDGYDGALFLQDVKTLLEDPTLMFMEMV